MSTLSSGSANSAPLNDYKLRAEEAEKKIKELSKKLDALQQQIEQIEQKDKPSSLILGAPSSMGDNCQLNLRYLCERGVKVQPNSEIVTKISSGYHRVTYAKAQKISIKLASALQKIGINIGDRVGTFMWNNSRHFCLYYAVPSMGAVLHTLNIRLSPNDLNYIINHAQDKIIFVDSTILPLFERIDKNVLNNLSKIIICGPNESTGNWNSSILPQDKLIDFDEFLASGDDYFDWPNLDEKSGAALCYTSGTTNKPKGVMYSHRSCYLETLMMMSNDIMNISGADCVLPVVPMFHALAWCTPFSAFCLGYKYVLYNCFRKPIEFLDMVADEQVTLLLGVPTILNGIKLTLDTNTDLMNKYRPKIACWNRSVCGGSAPPPIMIKWYWDELNIEVIHGWGMTETNPVGSISRRVSRRIDLTKTDDEKYQNQIPQGLPCPFVDIKIVSPDNLNIELKQDGNDMGELLIRGPTVAVKYYKINAANKFHNGWLLTGDIASIRNDYLLELKDRSKDLIKSGGEWISSQLLENDIMGINGVDKAAVIGVKHPQYDERPIVIIQMKKDTKYNKPSLNDIKKYLLSSNKWAKWQLPDDIIFDNIPLTGTGKMSKMKIRQNLTKQKYVLPKLRATNK